MTRSDRPDDASLMRKVASGDRRAFLSLYDRHAGRVHGLALRMLGDEMSAEEVTQDAFVRMWSRAGSYDPERGRLISWLLTITRRLALDRIRFESRRPASVVSDNPDSSWVRVPDESTGTEEARWATLRFALEELPKEQRSVIELAFYHGMTHTQIADHQEIPLGTVKTRLRLGMEKLRRAWLD